MLKANIDATLFQRGKEIGDVSYLAKLKFLELLGLFQSERLYVPCEPELPDWVGRKQMRSQINSIKEFILSTYLQGMTFFLPLSINIQPTPTFEDGQLVMPYCETLFRLIDGHQRAIAIAEIMRSASKGEIPDFDYLACFEIPIIFHPSIPLEMERFAFRSVNLGRKVSPAYMVLLDQQTAAASFEDDAVESDNSAA